MLLTSVLVGVGVAVVGVFIALKQKTSKMGCNLILPIELTSTAIPPSPDGKYTFDQLSFLFPHEPLRRELYRGKMGLCNTDLQEHPWKWKYLSKWFHDFLIPLIYDHHQAEDQFFIPAYVQLGVNVDSHIAQGHHQLDDFLSRLEKLIIELDYLHKEFPQPREEIQTKFQQLETLYNDFYEMILKHLAEEELFWTPIVKDKGEDNLNRINKELHTKTKSQKTSKLFICSVLDSMGYEFDTSRPTHNVEKWKETRWCSEDVANEKLIKKIPSFVRGLIFPKMNRKYQYYKKMIMIAAYEKEDTLSMEYRDDYWWCPIC